ncbi:hypothetical protein [Psychrobacillus phage Perkons]|nr:hypothetical protein [Psychrobacillus phage Perkons]
MAQFKGETVFKKVQIDLADNILYEFTKEEVKEYTFSDLLNKFKGDNIFMEIKFFEHTELSPEDISDGE